MAFEELKNLTPADLKTKDAELRRELFTLKTVGSGEKVKDTSKFKKIKKDIARVQTLLTQQSKTASAKA